MRSVLIVMTIENNATGNALWRRLPRLQLQNFVFFFVLIEECVTKVSEGVQEIFL